MAINPRLGFRAKEELIEKVDKRAKELGLNKSEYLKMLVIEDLKKSNK